MPFRTFLPAASAAALAAVTAASAMPGGDQLWRFYADFAVTVAEPIPDLSGNGGKDLLVGSEDDTLYAVEARGAGKGAPLWAVPFRSTLSAAAALPDVTGDGRPDAVGGDLLGFMQVINGGTGAPVWKYLTFGAVLSIQPLPDVDGDKVPDVAFGSENDTLYVMKGKAGSLLGEVIWSFGAPIKRGRAPGDVGPPKITAKIAAMTAAGAPPKDGPSGVNGLALLRKNGVAHGIAAAVSNDTVYLFAPTGGPALWKTDVPGDAWKVAAFPDMDGDGIEEALVACGADKAFLLAGSDGKVIWAHAVSMGAVSVAAAGDMTGDGKADALIGDGGGKVHCVPGDANGLNAAAAWTYDFGDTSTIQSIAPLADVDGDGKADCAVGTSSDKVALISGKGTRGWTADLGGTVTSVVNMGDLDGNGFEDVGAGTESGFAAAFQGAGTTVTLRSPRSGARADRPSLALDGNRLRIVAPGKAGNDLAGRRSPALRISRETLP